MAKLGTGEIAALLSAKLGEVQFGGIAEGDAQELRKVLLNAGRSLGTEPELDVDGDATAAVFAQLAELWASPPLYDAALAVENYWRALDRDSTGDEGAMKQHLALLEQQILNLPEPTDAVTQLERLARYHAERAGDWGESLRRWGNVLERDPARVVAFHEAVRGSGIVDARRDVIALLSKYADAASSEDRRAILETLGRLLLEEDAPAAALEVFSQLAEEWNTAELWGKVAELAETRLGDRSVATEAIHRGALVESDPVRRAEALAKVLAYAENVGDASLTEEIRRLSNGASPPGEAEPAAPQGAEPSTEPPPEPVLLGVTAPREAAPGAEFTTALVAYIASARESAEAKLASLADEGDRRVLDVAPKVKAGWRVGAPVTVTVTGTHLEVTQPVQTFEWSGRDDIAIFAVKVRDDAPRTTVNLRFEVFLAEVPIAFVSVPLKLAATPSGEGRQRAEAVAARSVFVSYASADGVNVEPRLSMLHWWDPGLDIFQDCLDLHPNEAFKAKLEQEITARDVFLLFWSTHAKDSRWVSWEIATAKKKTSGTILPVPLEDPAIAPPPPEFSDRHMRDRYLLAWYALQKIHELKAAAPVPAQAPGKA